MMSTESLTAGRELNERVAEAMGIAVCKEHPLWPLHILNIHGDHSRGSSMLPAFSTSWEDMRIIVEWMCAKRWTLYLEVDTNGRTWARFISTKLSIVDTGINSIGDTAPLAVCTALLAAVEGEK